MDLDESRSPADRSHAEALASSVAADLASVILAPDLEVRFALMLVEMLVGKEKRKEVEGGLLLPSGSMGVEESSPDQVN